MNTRYAFSTLLAALGLMALVTINAAEAPKTDDVELLFVQSATSGTYDGKTLTLDGAPLTTYFSDRPKRVVGHLTTDDFVKQWVKGSDSFKKDPPNAAFSVLDKDGANDSVLELSNPQLNGDQISYQVKVLDGNPPKKFDTAALFIDSKGGAFLGGMALGHIITNRRR